MVNVAGGGIPRALSITLTFVLIGTLPVAPAKSDESPRTSPEGGAGKEVATRTDSADNAAARALYDEILGRYRAAHAMKINAAVTQSEPGEDGRNKTVAEGTLRIRVAKPLHGTFRRDLKQDGEEVAVCLVADGSRITYLDHDEKTYLDFGDSFSILCDLIKLDPFYAWAGVDVLKPVKLELLSLSAQHKTLRGLAIVGLEFRQELWVDRTGRLARASVVHDRPKAGEEERRKYARGRTDYIFSTMDLPAEAKTDDYVAHVPKDYKPMEDPTEDQTQADLLAVGATAPAVTLTDMNGQTLTLASLRGKTVLLNFWFYHCFSCRQEMPRLERLWKEVGKQRSDVVFLCIDLRDAKEVIQKYWESQKFTLRPVRQKDDEVSKAFGVKGYPTNYVLGPDGRIVYRAVGYDEKAVRRILGKGRTKVAAKGD